jgi:hypothetical protein
MSVGENVSMSVPTPLGGAVGELVGCELGPSLCLPAVGLELTVGENDGAFSKVGDVEDDGCELD